VELLSRKLNLALGEVCIGGGQGGRRPVRKLRPSHRRSGGNGEERPLLRRGQQEVKDSGSFANMDTCFLLLFNWLEGAWI
jgi:hypothetical protein